MDVSDKFIILKKTRYSEADLIIQALSSTGSKMSFMARSALKSKKRFGGGVLEPLHFVQFSYQPGKEGGLNALHEATLLNGFEGLKKDYDRLEFALRALEAVGKVSQEGDSTSQFLFNLIGHTLSALSKTEKENWTALKIQFWLKFLLQQGVLTSQPWMGAFLNLNVADFEKIAEPGTTELLHLQEVQSMVDHYIKNAVVDHF